MLFTCQVKTGQVPGESWEQGLGDPNEMDVASHSHQGGHLQRSSCQEEG